jgi:hypothetical protein
MSIPVAAIEAAAEASHNAYEDAATRHGWETQERSRVPWSDVPEANKATVREAISAAIEAAEPYIREAIAQEIEADDGFKTHPWRLGLQRAALIIRGGAE